MLKIMLVLEKVFVCMQLPSDSSFTLLMSIGSGGMDLQNSDNRTNPFPNSQLSASKKKPRCHRYILSGASQLLSYRLRCALVFRQVGHC